MILDFLFKDKAFNRGIHVNRFYFKRNFPVVHHLSKFLIVSSNRSKLQKTKKFFRKLLNVVQIYEKNQKVIARSFDWSTQQVIRSEVPQNLSASLFRDKLKNLNLNERELYVAHMNSPFSHTYRDDDGDIQVNSKWMFYLEIITEKLNATIELNIVRRNEKSWDDMEDTKEDSMVKLIEQGMLDFFLHFGDYKFDLESYNYVDWCFIAPLPKSYSIAELILILPLDPFCWMWLGITVAISALLWRISEHHWNFLFGAFALFVGKWIKVRT